jgi:iron complex transport system ATP-binding protein
MGLIVAEGLAVGHGKRIVARDIGFVLQPGEIVCLLGPNGAGKTTLFRTLLGLIPARGGEVSMGGLPIGSLNRAAIARAVAYVPQSMSVPFPYAELDFVLAGRTARLGPCSGPGAADNAIARATLASVGLSHLAQTPVTQLSGGERQLVLIARALAQEAPAMILDGPAAILDFGNRERLPDRLAGLAAKGLGLIVSTHEPAHAARIATRVLSIDRKGVAEIGLPSAMLSPDRIAHPYDLPQIAARRALELH